MGGPGSGRHPDPINFLPGNQPVTGIDTQGFVLTNLSGVQTGALKTSKPMEHGIRYVDQFASIQAAINDLPSTGGIVYIPAGTYTITSKITMGDNVTLQGAGFGSTIIAGNLSTYMISSPDTAVRYFRWTIRDLRLTNNGSGGGIDFSEITLSTTDSVEISCNGIGMNFNKTLGCYYNNVLSARFSGCATGIYLSNEANENKFYGCRFNNCDTAFDVNANNTFISSAAIENAIDGVIVTAPTCTIIGCRFEVCTRSVTVLSGGVHCSIISCHRSTAPIYTDATGTMFFIDDADIRAAEITMSGAFYFGATAPTFAQTVASGATFVSGGALWFKGSTTQTQLAPA